MTDCPHINARVIRSHRTKQWKLRRRFHCLDCGYEWTIVGELEDWPSRCGRPVRCVETGQEWPTIKAAAATVFVIPQSISHALRTGRRCAGFRWERVA